MLSSVGHDLRTPLTAVSAAVAAIAAAHPREPAVATAQAELGRLRRFLVNLIEMVRVDSGAIETAPEPTDLTDAIAAAVHDLRDVLPDERIDFRVPPDLPLVSADPRLLHHIRLNLLTNAAVHGAGAITLKGERVQDAVRLSVADRGPGLPDAPEALFDRFARGDAAADGGVGLGLAIVRSFADAMGWRLEVGARDGGGAVFTLVIPVRKAAAIK